MHAHIQNDSCTTNTHGARRQHGSLRKSLLTLMALSGIFATSACGQEDTPTEVNTPKQDSALSLTSSSAPSGAEMWCPAGHTFNDTHRLCESATQAIGPFPAAMVADCEKNGGGQSCKNLNWSRNFARSLRGTRFCPKGTWVDSTRGECTDGTNVYGPFSRATVESCKHKGGGLACETMRWHASFVAPSASAVRGTWNKKTLEYYEVKANYDRVAANVFQWFGTRTNACVAFMSTALRQVGFPIPQSFKIDGFYASLWTTAFSKFLQNKGWVRINSHTDLQPGDIVFTVPGEDDPAKTPLHTYLFHSWKDRADNQGWVIDNQGFTHERAIFSYGDFNFSPFDYALRSRE